MSKKTKIKFKAKIILARTASLFFVLFLAAVNGNAVLAGDLHYNNPRITPAKMFSLTNQSREENGLFILAVNQKLTSAAEAKTDDMFKHQYFDHNSPSGATPWDWIKAAEYNYRYAGENLAIDFVTAESAHKALMASDSHRENILNQNYTEIGISVKKDIFEGNESIIVVMEFGTPLEIQTEAAYAGNDDMEPNGDISGANDSINSAGKELKKEITDEITNLQPSVVSPDLKKNSDQDIGGNIEKQESKEIIRLDSKDNKENKGVREDFKDSEKIVYSAGMIRLIGMSADNFKKNNLEKVYLENIYWKSYGKKNINGQTTVMSSIEQSKGGFNSDVFYVCVLLILFVFESSYVFSNFIIGGRLEMENVQSGDS